MLPLWMRQTNAQVRKNWTIHWRRHWFTTAIRSFLLPVIFTAFISFSRYLFTQPAEYGIGKPAPVLGLQAAMGKHPSKPLVFVTNGLSGDVDTVIENVQNMVPGGKFKIVDSVEGWLDDAESHWLHLGVSFVLFVRYVSAAASSIGILLFHKERAQYEIMRER